MIEGQKQNIIAISKLFLFLFDSNDVLGYKSPRKHKCNRWWEEQLGGLWAPPPAAGGQRGFGGGALNTAAIFLLFQKIKHFYAHFDLNFCLKTFLNDCKVCW